MEQDKVNTSSALDKKRLKKKIKLSDNHDTSHNSEFKEKKKRNEEKDLVVPDIICELKEDLDRELDIKAQRNNLTAANVKNMIKAVITDSEVLKMIDYSLDKSAEKPVYELKLTRAKTKELIGLDQNAIWSMPSTQKKSDIEALINQELSEDSSDEEYEPQDEGSDEDSKANENVVDEEYMIDDECSESDSPVIEMVGQDLNENNSDENIWQRTRSKLSLSETPLEAIEQAFIPPDITTDMYNTHCDNQDWLNFLKEIYYDSNQLENNDDENDPEYNVMVDEETEGTDMEELRVDRAVKITKKELNELMSELFEYTEMLSSDDEEESKDNDTLPMKPKSETKSSDSTSCCTTPLKVYILPPIAEPENEDDNFCIEYYQLSDQQMCLLKQQLEQHVQLLLQSVLLAYKHPLLPDSYALECKKRLIELTVFRGIYAKSFFDVLNLNPALDLINEWTEYLNKHEDVIFWKRFMEIELQKIVLCKKKKTVYIPKLHPKLIEFCLSSYAFMYPLYLPQGGFTGKFTLSRGFTFNENQLIAMGLEGFSDLLGFLPDSKENLRKIVELLHYYLVITKSVSRIILQIKMLRRSSTANPIKEYFEKYKAPGVNHFVVVQYFVKKLTEYPVDFFPQAWKKYLMRNYKIRL